jgi:DHA1 family bicyclomycin/chloramphenicol resistance-like MFS transporter
VIGWRAIFALYTAMGAACLCLCWIDWGETRVQVRRSPREQVAAYRALLGSGLFWAYAMCTAMSVGTFYIFLTGAPFVAQATFGLSTTWIGVGLGSITGGFMIGSTDHRAAVPTAGPAPIYLRGEALRYSACASGAGCSFRACRIR